MVVASHCPDAQTLEQLRLGQLSLEEVEQLAQHLEQCEHCAAAVGEISADDTLVEALRKRPTVLDRGEQDTVTGLVASLQERLPPPAVAFPGMAPGPETTQASAAAGVKDAPCLASTQEIFDFLAPAEGPGELGRLGPYRITRLLGAGGMGVVFAAEDPHLRRTVALKVMLPSLAARAPARQRFLREARAMAAVKHDHIVTIYQVGEDRGVPFLTMELLEGQSLEDRLQHEKMLPLAEVLRIGREMAEGLAAAHAHGLIHRDIKPANVWLEEVAGGGWRVAGKDTGPPSSPATRHPPPATRVKILDFGLAREEEALAGNPPPGSPPEAPLTQDGSILGTPGFMAPEQTRGQPVDGRCDLFSLGCVLYRLTTGQPAFRGPDKISTLFAVTNQSPRPPHEVSAAVPRALSSLIVQLLAKQPEDRPASAGEVVRTLQLLERKLTPQKETAAVTLDGAQPPRRRTVAWLAAAAGAFLFLAAGVVVFFQTPRGTVRIEINDPDIKAAIDAGGFTITGADKTDIHIAAGKHALHVKRGELEFNTDEFTLKKGGTVTLMVEWFQGQVRVVQDGKVIGESQPPIDPAWCQSVAALPAAEQVAAVAAKLKERNPGFDGTVKKVILGGVVTNLEFLTDKVTDLSPVRGLPGLRTLICNGSKPSEGQLADLSPLKDMKLTLLDCRDTKVLDLSPLKDMKLTSLTIIGTQVSDLSPLKDMKLICLWCHHTPVSDLSPLKGMELEMLGCGGTRVPDLLPLKDLKLKVLSCINTKVCDLSPLKDMMSLKDLDCSGTLVSDLSPLKDLNLRHLSCHYTPVSDLSPLKDLKSLTGLECINTKVSDFLPLKDLKLTLLNCVNVDVSDLSPLKGMPLTVIYCNFKPERDAEILRSIKTLKRINDKPAEEFWKEVDAQKLPRP